jgi:L-amino acid N-acyltransferase YncA
MTAIIRLATPDDAPGMQAIYTPIVRETAISFELEPPTVEAMRQRIAEILDLSQIPFRGSLGYNLLLCG